ncbi:MAG: hypothetical protein IKT97_00405 [Spirochaetia bacterium]|nr:hypothetical protein [Spirochaetia bacterium]
MIYPKYPSIKIKTKIKEMMQFNYYHPLKIARCNAKPVYVDGIRYESLFIAGIESGITSVTLWKGLKQSKGAPVLLCGKIVCLETWLKEHPEFFKTTKA